MIYSEVKVGDVYSFEKIITQKEIQQFAELTGDFNSLHLDRSRGVKAGFKRNIAHGMLTGSLFSRLIGMMCPGEHSLYLSQTLEFRKPVYPDETITVRGTITQKVESSQMIVITTEVLIGDQVAIKGEARAKFLQGEKNV